MRISSPSARPRKRLTPDEVGDVAGTGLLRDLLRRAGLGDPARLQDDEPLGQRDGLHRVVRDQEADAVVAVELAAQLPAGLEPGAGIEGGERLVEQQEARLGGQRPGQRDALRPDPPTAASACWPGTPRDRPARAIPRPGPGPRPSALPGCATRTRRSPGRRDGGRGGSSGRRRPPDGPRAAHARRSSCRRGHARRARPAPRRARSSPARTRRSVVLPGAVGSEEPDDPPGRYVEFHVEFEGAEPNPDLGAQAPLAGAQLKTPPATGPGDRRGRPATRAAAPG